MIAVDTNILVYAHRREAAFHGAASKTLRDLAEGATSWAIPWPCIHEFLAVATHPRIFKPASSIDQALNQVESWLESPSLVLLSEDKGYNTVLSEMLRRARVIGPAIHDARIAALCLHHRVRELWTADRDFGRFAGLKIRNPLVTE